MTIPRFPHEPYISAVAEYLALDGPGPDDFWASSDKARTLEAHLVWDEGRAWPHGIHLVWRHPAEGWQWAPHVVGGCLDGMPAGGCLEGGLRLLPGLGLWADVDAVRVTARALLDGGPLPTGRAADWSGVGPVRRAVEAWAGGSS